ncbi:MAG: alpha/beta fold hydrolase [Promethearchaeota archaeon]
MDWSMDDLNTFRQQQKAKKIEINDTKWEFFDFGEKDSEFALVFLHGTTGSREIFWLPMKSLMSKYRVISFDLPPIVGVENLSLGIHEILSKNDIKKTVLIGTSFGGYLAQFFCSKYNKMVEKLVLSNTFITTHLYHQKYKKLLLVEKLIPTFLIKRFMKKSLLTLEHDQTREYLLNQLEQNITKKILMARLKSFITTRIIEVTPPDQVLIIETEDDPLVPKQLQNELKEAYPHAIVKTFSRKANHFPYLTMSDEYTQILIDFLNR